MVDITVGTVTPQPNAQKKTGKAGATITQGQAIYRDPADGLIKLADSNGASADIRAAIGIALHGAVSGQPLTYQYGGDINIGGLIQGLVYCLSETPGGIQPAADLASGEYTTVLGVAISTSRMKMGIINSGVTV